jgi:3-phenylpropionate/cinnamic acid dioxygenase small subunit
VGFISSNKDALLLRLQVEEFLTYEASLVDDRRYEEWLALFADDLQYRMPLVRNLAHSRIGQEYLTGALDVSWFDEGKETLATRVAQIRTGIHWAEEPLSRTTRLVTNVQVVSATPTFADATDVEVASKYVVNRNRTTETDDTVIGKRVDHLRRDEQGWLIYRRTVFINQTILLVNSLSFFV